MTPTRTADQARSALLEDVSATHVGDLLDIVTHDEDGAQISTHLFDCTDPAYPGWYWAVALVAAAGDYQPTVSEVSLLPGAAALVPPAWQPWSTRVQAGDLGVGDLLPTDPGDPRLAPGFTDTGDAHDLAPLSPPAWELGLGREAVLSPLGVELAVDRWLQGQTGPRAAMAKAAPAHCATCGFLAPIGGSLGQVFGLCANVHGAADGQIVALTFGCGAHSSVRIDANHPVPVVGLVVDDDADETSDANDLADFAASDVDEADGQGTGAVGEADDDDDHHDEDPDATHDETEFAQQQDHIDHMDEDALAASIAGEPDKWAQQDDDIDGFGEPDLR